MPEKPIFILESETPVKEGEGVYLRFKEMVSAKAEKEKETQEKEKG